MSPGVERGTRAPRGDAEEDYRNRCARILAEVDYGPRELCTLTDAEILALDGADARRFTPLLRIGQVTTVRERSALVDDATSRLHTAGTSADGTPIDHVGARADAPTVRTVLRMRRSWVAVLLLDQRTATDRQWVTVYLRADGRALTEVATPDGRHAFSAMKRAAALDLAANTLVPRAGDVGTDDPGRNYSPRDWGWLAKDVLAPARAATTVIAKRHDGGMRKFEDRRLAIYTFDDRTEMITGEPEGRIRRVAVSRRALRRRLADLTRPAMPGDRDD